VQRISGNTFDEEKYPHRERRERGEGKGRRGRRIFEDDEKKRTLDQRHPIRGRYARQDLW
jgi:hypothetical protein